METVHSHNGLRILVIEDETLIALLLEDMIMDLDAVPVGPFVTLAKALDAARLDDFDVALIDMNLGGEPGDPIAELLAARAIPFALATGGSAATYELGQTATLQKPFSFEDLAATVQKLDEARLRSG